MENVNARVLFFDRKLKRRFVFYIAAGVILLAVLAGAVVLREYDESLDGTLKEVMATRINLIKVKEATAEMKQSIASVQRIIGPDYFTNSSEKEILGGVDVIAMSGSRPVVGVTDFIYGDAEIDLPVTITGRMGDYSSFVNDVGRLHYRRFPFFNAKDIAIRSVAEETGLQQSGREKKWAVTYAIGGDLRLPRSSQPYLPKTVSSGTTEPAGASR